MGSSSRLAAVISLCLATAAGAQPLTRPHDKRPEWLRRDGIMTAGSWEPLVFRVRRDGRSYVPTPEQRAGGAREHSAERVTVRVPQGRQVRAVTLASPDRETDLPVTFQEQVRVVPFTVPELRIYEIAVLDLQ